MKNAGHKVTELQMASSNQSFCLLFLLSDYELKSSPPIELFRVKWKNHIKKAEGEKEEIKSY